MRLCVCASGLFLVPNFHWLDNLALALAAMFERISNYPGP